MAGFHPQACHESGHAIPPSLPSPLPGSTPFVQINNLNDRDQAIGVQGWEQGLNQLEQSVWFDGTVLHGIGNPAFIDNGNIITNDGSMRVWFETGGDAIYNAGTSTLTPFNGTIQDMRSGGHILWHDNFPGDTYYLTTPITGTTPLLGLMPAGSGFTTVYGVRMNESGTIIGSGAKNGGFHGFMLVPHRPVFDVGRLEAIVAQILTGVINDAGALILFGGSIIPLPPRGPVEAILAALPAQLAQTLAPLIETRPRDTESAAALRRRLAHTIARYRVEIPS